MDIRKASEHDGASISKLIMLAAAPNRHLDFSDEGWFRFTESVSIESTLARLEDLDRITSVAEDREELIGVISISQRCKIDQLFVHPNHLRQGTAKALWFYAQGSIAEREGNELFWVRSSTIGRAFYQSIGFRVEGNRQTFGGISFYLMRECVNKAKHGER